MKKRKEIVKMKKIGTPYKQLTNEQIKAVREYLEGSEGLVEVASKYGTNRSTLQYWVKKYRKEQELA